MIKRVLTVLIIAAVSATSLFGQNKKAERQAMEQAKFDKAKAAIDAKLFAMLPDSYGPGAAAANVDEANFLAMEEDGFLYLQGASIAGNKYTNKLEVKSYEVSTDKKGNVNLKMIVSGSMINGRVEIQMRKGSNYADVVVTPNSGNRLEFSGEILPKTEAKYFKRPNVI